MKTKTENGCKLNNSDPCLTKTSIHVYDMITVKDKLVMRNISHDKLIYNKNIYINFNISVCF